MRARSKQAAEEALGCALFLRGINVGGKRMLPMRELVALCKEIGCTQVQPYLQSGNVAVRVAKRSLSKLGPGLESLLTKHFGWEVPVIVRTANELREVVAQNPFLGEPDLLPHLHVGLLAARPSPSRARALEPERSLPDRFHYQGRELYLCCPQGLARSKLTNAYFDATLGTICTIRNWRTLLQMASLSAELA